MSVEFIPTLNRAFLEFLRTPDDIEMTGIPRIRKLGAPTPSIVSWKSSNRACCAANLVRGRGQSPDTIGFTENNLHHLVTHIPFLLLGGDLFVRFVQLLAH